MNHFFDLLVDCEDEGLDLDVLTLELRSDSAGVLHDHLCRSATGFLAPSASVPFRDALELGVCGECAPHVGVNSLSQARWEERIENLRNAEALLSRPTAPCSVPALKELLLALGVVERGTGPGFERWQARLDDLASTARAHVATSLAAHHHVLVQELADVVADHLMERMTGRISPTTPAAITAALERSLRATTDALPHDPSRLLVVGEQLEELVTTPAAYRQHEALFVLLMASRVRSATFVVPRAVLVYLGIMLPYVTCDGIEVPADPSVLEAVLVLHDPSGDGPFRTLDATLAHALAL